MRVVGPSEHTHTNHIINNFFKFTNSVIDMQVTSEIILAYRYHSYI